MAPPRKKKPSDEPGGGVGAADGASGGAEPPPPPADTVNSSLCTRMAEHLALIKDLSEFKDIDTAAALDIGNGGYQRPYTSADFKACITTGMYKCGFNIFAVNFNWSPTPGVPMLNHGLICAWSITSRNPRLCRSTWSSGYQALTLTP